MRVQSAACYCLRGVHIRYIDKYSCGYDTIKILNVHLVHRHLALSVPTTFFLTPLGTKSRLLGNPLIRAVKSSIVTSRG